MKKCSNFCLCIMRPKPRISCSCLLYYLLEGIQPALAFLLHYIPNHPPYSYANIAESRWKMGEANERHLHAEPEDHEHREWQSISGKKERWNFSVYSESWFLCLLNLLSNAHAPTLPLISRANPLLSRYLSKHANAARKPCRCCLF